MRRPYWILALMVLATTVVVVGRERWSEEGGPSRVNTPSPRTFTRFQTPTLKATTFPRFPLRVAAGRRHLVDAAGKPFLLTGDTAWSLTVQLKSAAVDHYLDDRRRKGFNAILVNLLEHKFGARAPRNAYGEAPFTRPGDFSAPNDAYFAHADAILEKARARGILVLLVPAYLGFDGGSEGWWNEMKANGIAKLRAYGRFVGTRYGRFENVLWVQGGDFDPPEDERELVEAVAEGIRSVDTKPQTFHGARGTSALAAWDLRPRWLDVNTIYTHEDDVVAHAHTEYRRSTTPFFLIEARYENEGFPGAFVRQQAYHAVLAGSSGSVMGNSSVWRFSSDWRAGLASSGTAGMAQLAGLFNSLSWWKLQPDDRHDLLVSGVEEGSEEAVAARAGDGSFALIYAPSGRTLEIDLSRLRGPRVSTRWYDPVSGRFRRVPGSPFRADSRRSLATPAKNAGGDSDIVLLLESVP